MHNGYAYMKIHSSFTIAAMFLLLSTAHVAAQGKPNVVLVVADDLGYADVGFHGSGDVLTPHIDRIAREGVMFSSGYVSFSVCSPSRAGFLTGRYGQRFGYERNVLYYPTDAGMGMSREEETMADILGRAGYRSMLVGKWHLGAHPSLQPQARGFSEFYGFLGGGHQYFPDSLRIVDPMKVFTEEGSYRTLLNRGTQPVTETEYITDAFSREAVAFIDRNRSNPFFLYLAYNAPHAPLQAPPAYQERYSHIKDRKRRNYAAMVSAMDDGVGRVLAKLRETGLDKNTLVVFISDNGGPLADNGSSNGSLRGKKGGLYEGGIRVPFAMRWPEKIPAGKVYDRPVITFDILATILGGIPDAPRPKQAIDGVDLIPFVTGNAKNAPHPYLFWRQYDQKSYAVIRSDQKKMLMLADTASLFDLGADRSETRDLAQEKKSVVRKLRRKISAWEKELKPPSFLGLTQRAEYIRAQSAIKK